MEEIQKDVNETLSKMLAEIDSKCLRAIQANAHRCAVGCYERANGSYKTDADCADRCLAPALRAHQRVQAHLEHYTRSIGNCMRTCNDFLLYTNADNSSAKSQDKFNACAKKCVSDFAERKHSVLANCFKDLLTEQQKY